MKEANPFANIGYGFAEIICDKKQYIEGSKCWKCPYCQQEGVDGFSEDILSEGFVECPNNNKGLSPSYDI
jgi:hypothetical protein